MSRPRDPAELLAISPSLPPLSLPFPPLSPPLFPPDLVSFPAILPRPPPVPTSASAWRPSPACLVTALRAGAAVVVSLSFVGRASPRARRCRRGPCWSRPPVASSPGGVVVGRVAVGRCRVCCRFSARCRPPAGVGRRWRPCRCRRLGGPSPAWVARPCPSCRCRCCCLLVLASGRGGRLPPGVVVVVPVLGRVPPVASSPRGVVVGSTLLSCRCRVVLSVLQLVAGRLTGVVPPLSATWPVPSSLSGPRRPQLGGSSRALRAGAAVVDLLVLDVGAGAVASTARRCRSWCRCWDQRATGGVVTPAASLSELARSPVPIWP